MNTNPIPNHLVERLIGVVDLADGAAVHAIAGNRSDYRPVRLPKHASDSTVSNAGCPKALLDFYRQLGLSNFYVADLSSLTGGKMQFETLAATIAFIHSHADVDCQNVLVDIGFTGKETEPQLRQIADLFDGFRNARLVIASESVDIPDWTDKVLPYVPPERTVLSLDYRAGRFACPIGSESDFLDSACRSAAGAPINYHGAIVLDTATVGTQRGPLAAELCRSAFARIRRHGPLKPNRLISGGGIRNREDVQHFVDAGCDQVLVATWLLNNSGY